jgi:hypothetical protein
MPFPRLISSLRTDRIKNDIFVIGRGVGRLGVEAFFVEEEDSGAEGEERAAKAKLEIRN